MASTRNALASLGSWSAASTRVSMVVMSTAFCIFGLSMVFQPHRWAATPAYHLLLELLRAQAWGGLFLAAGISLGVACWQIHRRWLLVAALTLAFMLTNGWMLAFVVRYLTSSSTTPETWVSWAVFDYILIRISLAIDFVRHDNYPESPQTAELRRAVDYALTVAAQDQRTRTLAVLDDTWRRAQDEVASACYTYSQSLAQSPDDPALLAIAEARRALARAEEAYSRTQALPPA